MISHWQSYLVVFAIAVLLTAVAAYAACGRDTPPSVVIDTEQVTEHHRQRYRYEAAKRAERQRRVRRAREREADAADGGPSPQDLDAMRRRRKSWESELPQ